MYFDLVQYRRSFLGVLLRVPVLLLPWLLVLSAYAGAWFYGSLVATVAPPAEIHIAIENVPSDVRSARGFVIGGLERGGRAWTDYADISDEAILAFIAAEDQAFFEHGGFDLRGIARAAVQNLRAGSAVQGGSTITQQLAKSFVGDDRTFGRKLEELVVARRLELMYSKAEIFEAWVNRIYFGAGATGIGAAADIYFGVEPGELTLEQAALLASMVPGPGRFSPWRDPDEARDRRNRVLYRANELGLISDRRLDRALNARVEVVSDDGYRVHAPGLERAVWRELYERDDDAAWRYGDRTVHTAFDLARQRRAEQAMRAALYALDRRQGLRGVLGRVAADDLDAFTEAWDFVGADMEARPAIVTRAEGEEIIVWAGEEIAIPREGWNWAVPFMADASNHAEVIERAEEAWSVGDVVLLHEDGGLAQEPRLETAYGSMDIADGTLEAMIGGFDPDRNDFDRLVQGCRQPGSTFKPIVYSVALEFGFTPGTLVRDAPIRIELGPFEEWRPRNADGSFDGHITLWEAFIWSRNLPAISIYQQVGARRVIARARALGITSELDAVESLALGASCLAPTELLTSYSTFARGGRLAEPRVLVSVDDPARAWRLEDVTYRLNASPAARLDALSRRPLEPVGRQLRRSTAFQVAALLHDVVRFGTGSDLNSYGIVAAGKTGTTNAYDAWFSGFTSRDVAVTWIGADRNLRPLGRSETGGHVALPAWGAAALPPGDAPVLPPPPDDVIWVDIDPETGHLGAVDRYAIVMPFVVGTEPVRVAPSQDVLNVREIDRVGRRF